MQGGWGGGASKLGLVVRTLSLLKDAKRGGEDVEAAWIGS